MFMSNIINLDNALIFGGSGMIGSYIHFGIKPSSNDVNILEVSTIDNYRKYGLRVIVTFPYISII